MATPIQNLRVGEVVTYRVGDKPALVVEQNIFCLLNKNVVTETTFWNDDGSISVETSGFAERKNNPITLETNVKSGITHKVVDGKPLCGIRHGQNSVTGGGAKLCQLCK